MDKNEIFERITTSFRETFNSDIDLSMQTVLSDTDVWDSMGQISFLSKLEKMFSVKFKMSDLISFRTIGQIVEGIANKLK